MVYTNISGKDLKKYLIKHFGYVDISQKGSHMKIRFHDGSVIIIPDHKSIKEGLFNAILSQVGEKHNKSKLDIFIHLFGK